MKVLTVNGLKYSKEEFNDYKIRCKVEIWVAGTFVVIDLYTTDTNKESVENVLLSRKSDKVTSLSIIHWATKEQDDACSELINELLNEKQ